MYRYLRYSRHRDIFINTNIFRLDSLNTYDYRINKNVFAAPIRNVLFSPLENKIRNSAYIQEYKTTLAEKITRVILQLRF
jgi:hypothetical protein